MKKDGNIEFKLNMLMRL